MLFNSLSFLIFFPIVLLVYFIIPKKIRYILLLVASYYFYMCWNAKYALLLFGSTIITYLAGLVIKAAGKKVWLKKTAVAFSLILNFGILFFFKYFDFVFEGLEAILGELGIVFESPKLDILLPVGISFYIFQAVGYTIDVYRNKIDVEKNVLRYALFVSFFPQLVAGPIERSTNLLSQLRNVDKLKLWDAKRIQSGALVMLYGYFMKMILADRIATVVDTVYDPVGFVQYSGFLVLIAAMLFSIQIYCDFAGYTYIAIGAAKIIGFDLMNNFNTPYFAVNIKDFWDRWHISLTTWFKDYLYFPLGGSKKGKIRKYFNILIVFILSGLWHGSAWHYVVWGTLHGVCRIVGEMTQGLRTKIYSALRFRRDTLATKLWQITFTFLMVTGLWMFFRGEDVYQTIRLIRQMLTYNPWVLTDGSLFTLGLDAKEWNVMLTSLLVLGIIDICKYKKIDLVNLFMKQNLWFRWLFFYAGIMAVVVFGVYGPQYNAAQFIYFQF